MSGVPAEAITFGVFYAGKRIIAPDGEELSEATKVWLSILGGTLGAPWNASLEQGMIRQELYGNTYWWHLRQIHAQSRMSGVFKATGATAARDSIFTIGVFSLTDAARAVLTPVMPRDAVARDLAAGLAAGMVAGFVSTPFDTCKTLMQQDINGKEYPTFRATFKALLGAGGMRAIFRGAKARVYTVGALCCATSWLKDRVPDWLGFPQALRETQGTFD